MWASFSGQVATRKITRKKRLFSYLRTSITRFVEVNIPWCATGYSNTITCYEAGAENWYVWIMQVWAYFQMAVILIDKHQHENIRKPWLGQVPNINETTHHKCADALIVRQSSLVLQYPILVSKRISQLVEGRDGLTLIPHLVPFTFSKNREAYAPS